MYAIVQKNDKEQYTVCGELKQDLAVAKQRYAGLLELFMKHMHDRQDLMEKLMPQLVKIHEQGLTLCETNEQMIEEVKRRHDQEKKRRDSFFNDIKRQIEEHFSHEEDRIQFLKHLARETVPHQGSLVQGGERNQISGI